MANITIVVPIRNCEATLPRLLNCYKNLNRKEDAFLRFEIQPCTDKSEDIIKAAVEEDPSISYRLHSLPLGAGQLRKEGAEAATSDYVCFSDGDDYFEKDFILDYLEVFEATSVDAIDTSFILDRPNRKPRKYAFRGRERVLNTLEAEKLLLNDISMRSFLTCKAFKRSLFDFEDLEFGEPRHIFEDLGLCFTLFYHCKSIAYINKANYHYVKGAPSLTSSCYIDRPLQHVKAFQSIRVFVEKKNDEKLMKVFRKSYLRSKLSFNYDVSLAKKAGAKKAWIAKWKAELRKTFH